MYFIIDTANCTCVTPIDLSNEAYAVLLELLVPPVNVSGRETEVSDGRVSLLYASVVALEELESSLLFLAQEKTVRLKRDMSIMCKIFFILFLHQ
jgi:hypothetical protein